MEPDQLVLAAGAATFLSPVETARALRAGGHRALEELVGGRPHEERIEAERIAANLTERGFEAVLLGDSLYPSQLLDMRRPPPVLFVSGDTTLLQRAGVGICGSRRATDAGLRAARACGLAVARAGLTVISGNAKGVDTEAHRAALDAFGATVLVLAEGALRYRPKRDIRDRSGVEGILAVSQFPPQASWSVGNAMTRNGLIAALGEALVVIEAGAEGGTLDAGLQGLAMGRPVIALEFESEPTPAGNTILHSKGALSVRSPASLTELIDRVRVDRERTPQLTLPLASNR